jgi:nucleoside 2-deoxyribosyltransferase
MADPSRVCWICQGEFAQPFPRTNGTIRVDCSTCGNYEVSESLRASNFPLPDGERYRFSYWCKQRELEGRDPPSLTAHTIAAIVSELPSPPTHAKADILLRSLTLLYPEPGKSFKLDSFRQYPLAAARGERELLFHIERLSASRYLQLRPGREFTITGDGWEQAAEIAAGSVLASKTAFVALWFDPEILQLWKTAFKPAIVRAGFEPQLANDPTHNEQIDAHIVAQLKECRFVVADVTGARTGVYFEAGFALGQKKPVIWTCKADRKGDMHFDTRQYNHILWKDAEDLKEQLYYRIVATI